MGSAIQCSGLSKAMTPHTRSTKAKLRGLARRVPLPRAGYYPAVRVGGIRALVPSRLILQFSFYNTTEATMYLSRNFFIFLSRRFMGAEWKNVKLLLLRYIHEHALQTCTLLTMVRYAQFPPLGQTLSLCRTGGRKRCRSRDGTWA